MIFLQLTAESGHPLFRASSAFERVDLGSKGHGKKSTQFNDNEGNIEMLLRTVISVNQLSIYRAWADLCNEFKQKIIRRFRKLRNTLRRRDIGDETFVLKCQNSSPDDRHSQKVYRKEDGGVHYDQTIDEKQEKAFGQYRILVS